MLSQSRNFNLCFLNSFPVLLHPLAKSSLSLSHIAGRTVRTRNTTHYIWPLHFWNNVLRVYQPLPQGLVGLHNCSDAKWFQDPLLCTDYCSCIAVEMSVSHIWNSEAKIWSWFYNLVTQNSSKIFYMLLPTLHGAPYLHWPETCFISYHLARNFSLVLIFT